jgi:hypothetical protein
LELIKSQILTEHQQWSTNCKQMASSDHQSVSTKKGNHGITLRHARGSEEGKDYLDAEVSRADNVLDLAGHEHGLELGGQVRRPVRDVQIP